MSAPRHYYHVTQTSELNGARVVLEPRWGNHMAWGEGEFPRICVAPTPIHCLAALGNCLEYHRPIRIYRTSNPVVGKKPQGVDDAKVTKERWLLEPTEFILWVEVLPSKLPEELFRLGTGGSIYIPGQVKIKKQLRCYRMVLVPESEYMS